MAYTRGNLAVKQNTQQQRKSAPQQVKETTTVVTRRKELPTREKLLYLMSVIVCVVIAGLLISRYADIYQVNRNISSNNSQLSDYKLSVTELKLKKEKLSESVVERAKTEGYVMPTTDPIRVSRNGDGQ
ncbi:hypothetical protein Q5741_03175 [Paenibacillus sp. JX-17]|uniref:Cell division protein FtsL n=1 Tax=Paenibacillus lacisoli TaxID=3064525 RepID=A0ABT9CBR2_9BACL|nr:hypothetical protein [Paenibacillus sp. JX-17]MDO7905412.1 hypothetical protein [Paenibacillus sp. JX-17]